MHEKRKALKYCAQLFVPELKLEVADMKKREMTKLLFSSAIIRTNQLRIKKIEHAKKVYDNLRLLNLELGDCYLRVSKDKCHSMHQYILVDGQQNLPTVQES